MESQVYAPAAYAPDASYYIPPEDVEDDADAEWAAYCRTSSSLDAEDLMTVVGEMFSNSELLRNLILEALANPFGPDERKHLHINDCVKLGDAVATMIAQACEDAVGMRQATAGGVR
jgi:hypothetical protein